MTGLIWEQLGSSLSGTDPDLLEFWKCLFCEVEHVMSGGIQGTANYCASCCHRWVRLRICWSLACRWLPGAHCCCRTVPCFQLCNERLEAKANFSALMACSPLASSRYYYHVDEGLEGGNMEFCGREPMDVLGIGDCSNNFYKLTKDRTFAALSKRSRKEQRVSI